MAQDRLGGCTQADVESGNWEKTLITLVWQSSCNMLPRSVGCPDQVSRELSFYGGVESSAGNLRDQRRPGQLAGVCTAWPSLCSTNQNTQKQKLGQRSLDLHSKPKGLVPCCLCFFGWERHTQHQLRGKHLLLMCHAIIYMTTPKQPHRLLHIVSSCTHFGNTMRKTCFAVQARNRHARECQVRHILAAVHLVTNPTQ